MQFARTFLWCGLLTAAMSAAAATVETPRLRVTFDDATGSLVSVIDRAALKPLVTGGDEDLWRVHLVGGKVIGSVACATNGAGVKVAQRRDGLLLTWSDADVTVAVLAAPNGDDLDLSPAVAAKHGEIDVFDFPANLYFDPARLTRMVCPGGPHVGLGFSFHGAFFQKRRDAKPGEKAYWWHGSRYPNGHADFWLLEFADGAALSGYGVQPRPAHEPWQMSVPFMRTHQDVGGTPKGGRLGHGYFPGVRPGESRRLPTFRLSGRPGLAAQLDAYAKANDLGKPLAEKVPAPTLDRLLHGPLVLIGGSADEIRRALPHISAPALVHVKQYLNSGFDRRYPDILPPGERFGGADGLKRLVDDIHARGMLFMPYTNPTWWSEPKGPSFQEAGEAAFWRARDGSFHQEAYGEGTSGWRTTLWHPVVRKANRRVVSAFKTDYPTDLLFQDQVGGRAEQYDFNPASPTSTSYIEGLLSMAEEDARDLPLGCEDGWDRMADINAALFGNCWRMFPVDIQNPDRHPNMKRQWPADLWEYEPVLPRLMKGNVLFYMHDLGQFVRNDRVLAWHVAFAYCLNATYHYDVFLTDNPHTRWYRRLCAVQRDMIAKIAAQPVVSFVHDRKPLLARDDIAPDSPLDDGTVVAQYGGTKVYVNLGDVTRAVGPYVLGPYGWRVVFENKKELTSEEIR